MKFVWLVSLLLIIVLTIDYGESWGRRRRRGRRRWGWVRKVVRGVGRFYRKHKRWIIPVAKIGGKLLLGAGKDTQALIDLATLKAYDKESYDEFMQQAKTTLEMEYPEEDIDAVMTELDQIADMHPDELELLQQDQDQDAGQNGDAIEDGHETDLRRDLTARVAALNLDQNN